ncbi:MAG: hypothetical protein KJ066_19125 [Acidobacteria bacterium]|nr:hypothetical protein [Acidobacteriota bacterium]
MHRIGSTVALVLLAGLVVACNSQAPAQAALQAAEQAVAGVRGDAKAFVPDEFKALEADLADARTKFDAGDYQAALEAAQGLPAKAQEVASAVSARRTELSQAWTEMQESLPGMVEQAQTRLTELTKMRRLPPGLDKATVDAAQTNLAAATEQWKDATAAMDGGDLIKAVEAATEVKSKTEAVLSSLTPAAS